MNRILAVVTAVILLVARGDAQEGGAPGTKRNAVAEPEFRPGIPGLTMEDVRDHKLLWREIEELQRWEQTDRISIAEYRSKVIEKTSHFLRLSEAAIEDFDAVASGAVTAVRAAFFKSRAESDPEALEGRFSADLRAAEARVTALLKKEPRHQLFAPECRKWLLRLAFGPKEAKEARAGGADRRLDPAR